MILNRNIFSILLFLFISSTVFATSEAEYKKLSKTYTLYTDGSQECRHYMELTLLTHTAMNRTYGESFIVYNPEYQELKIHSSFTRQKDGSIITTPENAFVEVLPRQAADAPAYNHLKEMVIVHTGLELGATIYLDYSVISKPGYLPELDICESIRQTSPVKEFIIDVYVPENKSLSYDFALDNIKPVIKTDKGKKQLTWNIKNLAAISREPLSTGIQGDVLFFTATTYPSTTDALNTLKKQFADRYYDAIKSLAESITRQKTTKKERVYAILKYITDDLSNSPLTIQETGFRIRPAEEVILSAYGTEAEKINLLAGLLDAADIENEIIAAFHPDITIGKCGLSAIQELFVKANTDGEIYYMTPKQKRMAETAWFADYAKFMSVTNQGESVQIMKPLTVVDYKFDIFITNDSANMIVAGKTGNSFLSYHSDYFKDYIANDKDASIISGNEYATFNYSMSQLLKEKTNDYIIFTLPDTHNSLSHSPYQHYNSKRSTRLLLPYKADEIFRYAIQLSPGIEMITPESMNSVSNPVGDLTVSIIRNDRMIEVVRSLSIKKQLITKADYAAFRSLMIEWGEINSRKLLFKVTEN